MDSRITLVAAVDADDCIYNYVYRLLYYYLIAHHGEFLSKLVKKTDVDEKDLADLENILLELDVLVSYKDGETHPNLSSKLNEKVLVDKILKNHGFSLNQFGEDKLSLDEFLAITTKTYRGYLEKFGESGQNILETILYLANKPFFHTFCNRIVKENISEFFLISGSNRQSDALDKSNSEEHGSGLFAQDLPILAKIFHFLLQDKTAVKCQLDDFRMAKIFDGVDCVFDETKYTLHYVIQNRFARKRPQNEIKIAFVDDRDDIHQAMINRSEKSPYLVYKNISNEYWHYNGGFIANGVVPIAVIPGTSEFIDVNYKKNIKIIIQKCENNGMEFDKSINAAVLLTDEDFKNFTRERMQSKENLGFMRSSVGTFADPQTDKSSDTSSMEKLPATEQSAIP